MKKVRISQVGGLDTRVLARMGRDGIAILTSAKVPSAVVLPFDNREKAARRYIALTSGTNGVLYVSRLKTRLMSKLRKYGALVVLLRGEPTAVLLPFPRNQAEASQNIGAYLR